MTEDGQRDSGPSNGQAPITLDHVRARFMEADRTLREASDSIEAIRGAAQRLGEARDGLTAAGAEVGRMVEAFEQAREQLVAAVATLDEGVVALQRSDPARIVERVNELGQKQLQRDVQIMEATKEAGTVAVGRFDETDNALAGLKDGGEQRSQAIAALSADLASLTAASAQSARTQLRATILATVLVLLAVVAVIAYLVTRPTA